MINHERLDQALAHYCEKYEQECDRWQIHEVTLVSPSNGSINVHDLTELSFRYLTTVVVENTAYVIGSDERVPRPYELCKLWALLNYLEDGFATEIDLNNYDGPYKI